MKNFLALLAALVLALSISAQKQSSTIDPGTPVSFAAPDMSGQPVDMAALKGKVVVINLWFINCVNCIEEIKALNSLVDENKANKDIVFLGLAASRKPDLEKFLVKNPFKYQIVPNAQLIILSKFGVPDQGGNINVPFPMHFVVDREGKVITKAQGIKGIDVVKDELKKQFSSKPAKSE